MDVLFGAAVACTEGIGRGPADGVGREVVELFIGVSMAGRPAVVVLGLDCSFLLLLVDGFCYRHG